jgi:hypothetical protein
MILEGQVEVAVALFGIASSIDELAVWFGPLFTIVCLHTLMNKHLPEGGFNQSLSSMDMQSLTLLFNNLTTAVMISFLMFIIPWIQLASSDGGI